MASNTNVPGLMLPTSKAMLAGNPRDSAIAEMNNANKQQNDLSAAVGGARRRKGGAITVPQFQMSYTDQSGPGGSPNDQVQANSQISTQQYSNAVYDANALKGGRRTRKGGNPDWKWGCYSGGRKKRTKRKTSRKRRTSRKRKTIRKQRTSRKR